MLEEHLRDFVNHSDRSARMVGLGMKREAYGFPVLAAESYWRALAVLDEEQAPPTDPGYVLAARNLTTILSDLSDYRAARGAAKRLLAADKDVFNGRFPKKYSARFRLAVFFAFHRRFDLAKRLVMRRASAKPGVPDAMLRTKGPQYSSGDVRSGPLQRGPRGLRDAGAAQLATGQHPLPPCPRRPRHR